MRMLSNSFKTFKTVVNVLSRNVKNIRCFLSEKFHFLVLKFSVYLNRHVFVMLRYRSFCTCVGGFIYCVYFVMLCSPTLRFGAYGRLFFVIVRSVFWFSSVTFSVACVIGFYVSIKSKTLPCTGCKSRSIKSQNLLFNRYKRSSKYVSSRVS